MTYFAREGKWISYIPYEREVILISKLELPPYNYLY